MNINEEIVKIYQAINAVSQRVNDLAKNNESYMISQVAEVTPYKATQTAYYGESEKVFYNVPQGNITVFWDNYNGDYEVERIADRIVVSFDALTDNATISIMIQ